MRRVAAGRCHPSSRCSCRSAAVTGTGAKTSVPSEHPKVRASFTGPSVGVIRLRRQPGETRRTRARRSQPTSCGCALRRLRGGDYLGELPLGPRALLPANAPNIAGHLLHGERYPAEWLLAKSPLRVILAAILTSRIRSVSLSLALEISALVVACSENGDQLQTPLAEAAYQLASAGDAWSHPLVQGEESKQSQTCPTPCLDIERCENDQCVPACPNGEVFIPRTSSNGFVLGGGEFGKRTAMHKVVLTEPFCMDETEVTVNAYAKCVSMGGCTLPQLGDPNSNYRRIATYGGHPINLVDADQALLFCKHQGKTLPTEAQWKWAASHGDGRIYPWGDERPTCENERADFTPGGAPKYDPAGNYGCRGGGTSPIKSFPKGNCTWPSGTLYDMGGNVWEWTRDCYRKYSTETQVDPEIKSPITGRCSIQVLVGGGWNRSFDALRIGFRGAAVYQYRVPGIGFRCIREPKRDEVEAKTTIVPGEAWMKEKSKGRRTETPLGT